MANPDDRFYKSETLLKWFGIMSVVMLIVTIWMVMDDFGREWKGYQREFMSLKKKKIEEGMEEAKKAVDAAKLEELNKAIVAADKKLEEQRKQIEPLEKEVVKLRTKEKNTINLYQGEKAAWDVEKYHYEAEFGHHIAEEYLEKLSKGEHGGEGHNTRESAASKKALEKLAKHWEKVLVLRDSSNSLTQQVDEKRAALNKFYEEKQALEKEKKVATAEIDRLAVAKESAVFDLLKVVRNSPILDLASPTLKLQQVVLPTIRDDVYFAQVQKVDRCTTCHLAIDLPGFENEKQPFRTHPRLDVMLGSRSPHPIDKIGCTVCHEGRGQSTDFIRSAHTPRNAEQEKEWKKKYGWHQMHHVIEKMVPLQYTEGKCRTCHKETEYTPKAEKMTASYQLIKASGCYGCHRIEGWDHLRKPAPSLVKVKGKLSRDWIAKWIRKPRSFNEHARMPATFFQTNMPSEEFKQYQEAELQAVTDYLVTSSEDYKPTHSGMLGNAERGKQLFGSVGCLGCHQISDFERTRGRFTQAPDLSTVGSKVSKDWLFSWLKNPRGYWHETTMPSFRLTDSEAADLTAYLMAKKNPEFEKLEAGASNADVQKKVLRMYLMRDPKMAPATDAKVDKYLSELSSHDVAMQLGKNAVMRYGCFGCHEIKGFENMQGIGTELTEWGSKPVNKLDFGLLHVHHSNYGWLDKKLENTRSYDEGLVKEYLDTLRMPNFEFNKEEREELTLALLGMTSQKVSPPAAKALNAHEKMVEDGSRLIHKYNCQGCHTVEMMHQPLPEGHPGFDDHEKNKFRTEGRILSYYQDDETLGPPPLVTEGERVQTPWAYSFLNNPGASKLRAKLSVRMPTFQFSNDELNTFVTGWGNATPHLEFPHPETRPAVAGDKLAAGKLLVQRLQCLNCHTVGERLSPSEMEGGSKGLAPDFLHANKRLRRDWIVKLLTNPQAMIPGTRMPGYWPSDGPSPAPDILKGDSKAQMEAVADYILSLGANRAAPLGE